MFFFLYIKTYTLNINLNLNQCVIRGFGVYWVRQATGRLNKRLAKKQKLIRRKPLFSKINERAEIIIKEIIREC